MQWLDNLVADGDSAVTATDLRASDTLSVVVSGLRGAAPQLQRCADMLSV